MPALEEDLKGFGEDCPPSLQARQLLRSFHEVAKKQGDRAKRLGGGNRFSVRTRHGDRRLSCMPHSRGDGMQQQRAAGDRFHMPIGLGQTNKDVPPVIKQRDEARGQAATRKVVRGEAAPAPLVLEFVENIFDILFIMPLIMN